jgi:threonyl-tRNA synthetase
LPERFDLTYVGEDNQKHRPVMIHRAPFGSMERFIAVLTEHCAGKFPLWLAPVQVKILPISDKFMDYALAVQAELNRQDVRTEMDDRNEKIGKKIREAELAKVAYMLIIGEKEVNESKVSVRRQAKGDVGQLSLPEFTTLVKDEVSSRRAFE